MAKACAAVVRSTPGFRHAPKPRRVAECTRQLGFEIEYFVEVDRWVSEVRDIPAFPSGWQHFFAGQVAEKAMENMPFSLSQVEYDPQFGRRWIDWWLIRFAGDFHGISCRAQIPPPRQSPCQYFSVLSGIIPGARVCPCAYVR